MQRLLSFIKETYAQACLVKKRVHFILTTHSLFIKKRIKQIYNCVVEAKYYFVTKCNMFSFFLETNSTSKYYYKILKSISKTFVVKVNICIFKLYDSAIQCTEPPFIWQV